VLFGLDASLGDAWKPHRRPLGSVIVTVTFFATPGVYVEPSEKVTVTRPGPEFTSGFDRWQAVQTLSPGAPVWPCGAPADLANRLVAAAKHERIIRKTRCEVVTDFLPVVVLVLLIRYTE